jgi:hypothetical protein
MEARRGGRRPARLFDLERDPAEEHDLAASESERLGTLGEELSRLRARAGSTASAPEIDEQIRRDLSGLGYLE